MKTSKRAEAARANGAKSRGPKTPEGKLRSQTHAIRHGLLAEAVVLEGEYLETFQLLMAEWEARFHPVGSIEFGMLEEMGSAYWRMRRTWIIEAEILRSGMRSREGNYDERVTATFTDPDNMPKLALLQRYETRLQRMYQRALNTLMILREEKRKTEIAEEPKEAEVQPVEPVAAQAESPADPPAAAPGAHRRGPQAPETAFVRTGPEIPVENLEETPIT